MSNILENHSALLNLKNRLGLNIVQKSGVSVYITEKKVKRQLEEILLDKVKDRLDRANTIDKIVDKCNLPRLQAIQAMIATIGEEMTWINIKQGTRAFIHSIEPFIVEDLNLEVE